MEIELYSIISVQLSCKNLRAMLLTLAVMFFFTSPHCLFPSMPLSILGSYSASILKQYKTLLMGTCFRPPYTWGKVLSVVLFSFDTLESKD